MHLSPLHVVGMLATIALIIGIGVYSGRKVKSAADFSSGGGKAGPWIVCGAIMGTLVSGQATIGTAQLAFSFGMSAWWFTLGSGIGCLILALGFAKPYRHSGCSTPAANRLEGVRHQGGDPGQYPQRRGYFHQRGGPGAGGHGTAHYDFPLNHLTAALISILLMAFYVIFGGVWGAGMGGRGQADFAVRLVHCGRYFGLRPGQRLQRGHGDPGGPAGQLPPGTAQRPDLGGERPPAVYLSGGLGPFQGHWLRPVPGPGGSLHPDLCPGHLVGQE